jgi:hypothetical protein
VDQKRMRVGHGHLFRSQRSSMRIG